MVRERGKPVSSLKGDVVNGAFDFAYIDADKRSYREYYELLIGEGLLRIGGLMVIDNVLFGGHVAERYLDVDSASDVSSQADEEDSDSRKTQVPSISGDFPYDSVEQKRRLKSLENARKIANRLHEFNKFVAKDPRTEHVVLPIRDGATILRRIR